MSDLLKGVLGGGRATVFGWLLPFALVAGLFTALVLPSVQGIPTTTALLVVIESQQGLLFLAAAVAGGMVLSALQTPLYRVLEGYLLWPTKLAEFRREAHRQRRDRLRTQADQRTGLRRALARERPKRYPVSEDDIAPTTFGNAIRRFEAYAFDRFRLDSQLVLQELRSLAPGPASREEDSARGSVDFFVCLFYSLLLLALSAGTVLIAGYPGTLRLALTAVGAVGGMVLAYHGAVMGTDRWAAAVRALVHLGRLPLAAALGLTLPDTLEAEREMWRRVNWLVRLDFDPRIQAELDPYRKTADPTLTGDLRATEGV